MVVVDVHSSAEPASVRREIVASLETNRLDPKGLYVTERQAELWQLVSSRHSPVHTRPEFRRIHQDAFREVATRWRDKSSIELIGLGSGRGEKEAQLCRELNGSGTGVRFTGIDVSEPLVRAAAERLLGSGASLRGSLVCDLAQTAFLRRWLDRRAGSSARLFSFFGLVPNFTPSRLTSLLRELLRPGDFLLASVHLLPSDTEDASDLSAAMNFILPQYDNAETLGWLKEALDTWDLRALVGPPVVDIGEVEGLPAFLGTARWKPGAQLEKGAGECLGSLQMFQSLRYTPCSFERLLRIDALQFECLAVTDCGEEGIWAIWV